MCCTAGFFLFAVQPFKLGDRVAVSYSSPAAAGTPNRSAWFEGTCEKVDLRCAAHLELPELCSSLLVDSARTS